MMALSVRLQVNYQLSNMTRYETLHSLAICVIPGILSAHKKHGWRRTRLVGAAKTCPFYITAYFTVSRLYVYMHVSQHRHVVLLIKTVTQ